MSIIDKPIVKTLMLKGEKGDPGDLDSTAIVDNLTTNRADKVLSARQGKLLKDLVDENTGDISTNATNISDETSARQSADENLQNQINVEKARIDNITNLPEGSTSGDAELQDIRISYNGETYENAGDSVRGQANYLSKKIDDLGKISGIYEELAILENGSIPSASNPDAVHTDNLFRAKAGDIASVYIKKPVSQEGNIYCLSYALYDSDKTFLQNHNYDTNRTGEFIVTDPTNVNTKTAYIKIGIWEYNPTSEELVSLRKTDFSPNDVIIKITDRNLVKLNKNILEGQIYFNAYANPIFEKDSNNNLYFHFEQSIITRGLNITLSDKTLVQLTEIVGETYTGTSPSGLTGCLKLPSTYNLVIDLENETYAVISRDTKDANRYLELLCNASGIVVKGILKPYYDSYMNSIKLSYRLNKSILEGQIYFNAYANPIFEKDNSNNLYFHYEQSLMTRGLNVTISDKTLAQLAEIVGETYTGTSPSGLTGCLKLPSTYNLVLDLENQTYAVISRDVKDANRYLELLCNAGGIVVKGILKHYYDSYMDRTTGVSNKLNKSILEGQIYFNAYANPIFEKDNSNNLYFHYEQSLLTRELSISITDKTLAQLTELLGETYTGTSPSGLTGCIKIPSAYNLVLDFEEKTYAIIPRSTKNANRYLELLCNVSGVVVKGVLKHYYDSYIGKVNNTEYIEHFGIPSYWHSKINQVITEVQNNLINSDGEYSNFFFITDQHWARNAKNSSKIIKFLARKLHIPLVLSGGDVNWKDYETKIEPISEEEDYIASLEDGYLEVFQTYGNHDFNNNNVGANPDYALTQNQVFEAMIKQINRSDKVNTLNKDVMYYDNENEHLRIINFKFYLDNNNPQVDNNIKSAITSLVNELDNNWSIVFFCHSFWTGAPAPSSVGLEYAEHIASLSYTANAKVLCLLVGHSHKDLDTTVTASNGGTLKVIGTTTDCIGVTHEPTMTRNTNTEQAFDIVQIDKTHRKIFMTRVGAGLSREFDV